MFNQRARDGKAGLGTLQNGLHRRFPAMICMCNPHQPTPLWLVGVLTHFFKAKFLMTTDGGCL